MLTSLIKRKNVIFPPKPSFLAKKKAPAASCQPRKMVLFLKIGVPTKIQTKIKEKGGDTHDLAILRSESHENCFGRINFSRRIILKPLKKYLVTKKETLTFYEKSPLFLPKKRQKNTKIVTKWSSMGRNRTSTRPK